VTINQKDLNYYKYLVGVHGFIATRIPFGRWAWAFQIGNFFIENPQLGKNGHPLK